MHFLPLACLALWTKESHGQELVGGGGLTPFTAGSRDSTYGTVTGPGLGFFVGGSSLSGINGVYERVATKNEEASSAAHAQALPRELLHQRRFELAYVNAVSGWILGLASAPCTDPPHCRQFHSFGGLRTEWLLVDPHALRDRFGCTGESLLPGWGDSWGHLDGRYDLEFLDGPTVKGREEGGGDGGGGSSRKASGSASASGNGNSEFSGSEGSEGSRATVAFSDGRQAEEDEAYWSRRAELPWQVVLVNNPGRLEAMARHAKERARSFREFHQQGGRDSDPNGEDSAQLAGESAQEKRVNPGGSRSYLEKQESPREAKEMGAANGAERGTLAGETSAADVENGSGSNAGTVLEVKGGGGDDGGELGISPPFVLVAGPPPFAAFAAAMGPRASALATAAAAAEAKATSSGDGDTKRGSRNSSSSSSSSSSSGGGGSDGSGGRCRSVGGNTKSSNSGSDSDGGGGSDGGSDEIDGDGSGSCWVVAAELFGRAAESAKGYAIGACGNSLFWGNLSLRPSSSRSQQFSSAANSSATAKQDRPTCGDVSHRRWAVALLRLKQATCLRRGRLLGGVPPAAAAVAAVAAAGDGGGKVQEGSADIFEDNNRNNDTAASPAVGHNHEDSGGDNGAGGRPATTQRAAAFTTSTSLTSHSEAVSEALELYPRFADALHEAALGHLDAGCYALSRAYWEYLVQLLQNTTQPIRASANNESTSSSSSSPSSPSSSSPSASPLSSSAYPGIRDWLRRALSLERREARAVESRRAKRVAIEAERVARKVKEKRRKKGFRFSSGGGADEARAAARDLNFVGSLVSRGQASSPPLPSSHDPQASSQAWSRGCGDAKFGAASVSPPLPLLLQGLPSTAAAAAAAAAAGTTEGRRGGCCSSPRPSCFFSNPPFSSSSSFSSNAQEEDRALPVDENPSHYSVLGNLPHDFTEDELKRAYRAASKRHHPDKQTQQHRRRQQQQQQQQQEQQRNEERTRQQQPQQQNSAAAPFSSTLSGAEEAVAVSAFGDAATTTTSAKAKARDKDEDKDEDKDGAQEVAAAMAAAQRRFERVAAAHECLSSSDQEPGQGLGQGCRSAFDQGDGVWAVFANSEQVEAAKEVGLALHLLSKEKAERAGFGLPDLEDEVREAYWPHESPFNPYGDPLVSDSAGRPPELAARRRAVEAARIARSEEDWRVAHPVDVDFTRLLS